MKNTFVATIFLVFFFPYCPFAIPVIFGINSTTWNVKDLYQFGLRTDSLQTDGDTIIGSLLYKKLLWLEAPWGSSWGHTSYLREDTAYGRLWHKSAPDSQDILVIDMSLVLGDTFHYRDPNVGYMDFVVDSVYSWGGIKHIRLYLGLSGPGQDNLYFMEGIGTDLGISYCENTFPVIDPYLLCQKKDNVTTYVNNHQNFQGKCNVTVTNIPTVNDVNEITLYPNPAKEYLSVKRAVSFPGHWVIFDEHGRKLMSQNWLHGLQTRIDISSLPQGIYVLRITSTSHHSTYKGFFLKK